jgi:hypothetical protein
MESPPNKSSTNIFFVLLIFSCPRVTRCTNPARILPESPCKAQKQHLLDFQNPKAFILYWLWQELIWDASCRMDNYSWYVTFIF